jgi:hypothetical protein
MLSPCTIKKTSRRRFFLFLINYGQSPWPGFKPRVALQIAVAPIDQTILAAAPCVGVNTNPKGAPAESVAPEVAVITPLATVGCVVTFLVILKPAAAAVLGIPFVLWLQPVNVPVSATQSATAVLIDAISATAPAARVRDV